MLDLLQSHVRERSIHEGGAHGAAHRGRQAQLRCDCQRLPHAECGNEVVFLQNMLVAWTRHMKIVCV